MWSAEMPSDEATPVTGMSPWSSAWWTGPGSASAGSAPGHVVAVTQLAGGCHCSGSSSMPQAVEQAAGVVVQCAGQAGGDGDGELAVLDPGGLGVQAGKAAGRCAGCSR